MYTGKRYSAKNIIYWTHQEMLLFIVLGLTVAALHQLAGLTYLTLPWRPIALIGTAVAFILGFQNNAAYGRLWEARKIWGGMVNISRTWAMKTRDMVSNEYCSETVSEDELAEHHQTLVYRHLAWLTALRHAMRQKKPWETFEDHATNRSWAKHIHIPEKIFDLGDDLFHYLSDVEWHKVMEKNNKPSTILFLQSEHLKQLKERGIIWEFSFLELENLLQEMFELQGKSERIKNFPYPRQYATLSYYFVWLFIWLLPFGIIPEFMDMGKTLAAVHPTIGHNFIWLGVPFSAAISWVFHTTKRIGIVGENPFEGTSNDVPISTIARGIEIDLRQMLDEDPEMIPKQFPEEINVQM